MKAAEFPPGTRFYRVGAIPAARLPSGRVINCYGTPRNACRDIFREVWTGRAWPITEEEFDRRVEEAARWIAQMADEDRVTYPEDELYHGGDIIIQED